MTIYNTAYQTTACGGFRMDAVVNAVREAQLRDYLPSGDGVVYVEQSTGASGQIKAFRHAVFISKHAADDIRHSNELRLEPFLAMDVRAACRFDPVNGKVKVTNSTLYKSLVYRAVFTSLWLTNGPSAFRAFTPMAMGVYASWLSEAISFRYNLDPKAKLELMIIAAIFYQSNHIEGTTFDKGNEARYLAGIANALKLSVSDVARIYSQTQAISSVEDFCQKVKVVLNNVRLENLNHGLLVSLMGSTWAGDNAVELTAVALEHPPTWVSLLYEAVTNTALKKVGLSKICERRQYQEGLERMQQSLKGLALESSRMVENLPSFY